MPPAAVTPNTSERVQPRQDELPDENEAEPGFVALRSTTFMPIAILPSVAPKAVVSATK